MVNHFGCHETERQYKLTLNMRSENEILSGIVLISGQRSFSCDVKKNERCSVQLCGPCSLKH